MEKTLFVVLLAITICAVVSAHSHFDTDPLLVQGKAYCDTCQCGYENQLTKYLFGASVEIQCRSRKTSQLTFTKPGVTDSTGTYKIPVDSDVGDDFCDVVLVKSSDPECSQPSSGRDRARVILTRNNGMSSNTRFANPIGFAKRTPLASCTEVLKMYQESEE